MVFRWSALFPTLPAVDWLKGDEEHKQNTEAESSDYRPGASAGGDLPEPAPVQGEVKHGRGHEDVADPGVQIPPVMASEPKGFEASPPTRAWRHPKGEQQAGSCHGTKAEPEGKVEKTRKKFAEKAHGVMGRGDDCQKIGERSASDCRCPGLGRKSAKPSSAPFRPHKESRLNTSRPRNSGVIRRKSFLFFAK